MFGEVVAWRGWYQVTYQDEIDEFLGQFDSFGYESYDLSKMSLEDDSHPLYAGDEDIFSDKCLLISQAQEMNKASVTRLIRYIEGLECAVNLALVYNQPVSHGALKTPEGVHKALADSLSESPRMNLLYRDDGKFAKMNDSEQIAHWVQTWLRSKSVLIDDDLSMKVSEYFMDETDSLVSFAMTVASGYEGSRVTEQNIDDLLQTLPLGQIDSYHLVSAILSGDRRRTAETLARVSRKHARPEEFALVALAMITNKFRVYCSLKYDKNADLSVLGVSEKAQYYARQESRMVNPKNAAKIMAVICDADLGMKGESDLPATLTLNILCDKLTRLCAIQGKRLQRAG